MWYDPFRVVTNYGYYLLTNPADHPSSDWLIFVQHSAVSDGGWALCCATRMAPGMPQCLEENCLLKKLLFEGTVGEWWMNEILVS